MKSFKNATLKENLDRITSPTKLSDAVEREVDMASDIGETWQDKTVISDDVREFLMMVAQRGDDDYVIDDMINAITRGIDEYRKIVEM
tara:strand:- start:7809 stop:8072 length:264 start_codon:yes stop_codon:yes gene_type:complete